MRHNKIREGISVYCSYNDAITGNNGDYSQNSDCAQNFVMQETIRESIPKP